MNTSFQTTDDTDAGSSAFRLSNFGILGYGYDVVRQVPRDRIANFTYGVPDHVFDWNGRRILIPNEFNFSPSPSGNLQSTEFSNRISTAREYQIRMKASLGLSATDPETDVTFSADAATVNHWMKQEDSRWAFSLYLAQYTYVFLAIRNISISSCIAEPVRRAADTCGTDPQMIRIFYDVYGTHVVTRADVGGELNINTSTKVDSDISKQIVENGLNVSGEVKDENEDHANGKFAFKVRDDHTDKLYRSISSSLISLNGGDMGAKDVGEWRNSLLKSEIPAWESTEDLFFVHTGRAAALRSPRRTTNLALVNLQYSELYRCLGLPRRQEAAFEEVLLQYLSGVNPFKNRPQRLKPDMDDSVAIKPGQKAIFEMRGWLATYETFAGLYGKPGSRAIVRCMSDAEPGGWTEQLIYAGEKIKLRDKTAYLSRYMYVEFVSAFDDDEAVVYAENNVVPWI